MPPAALREAVSSLREKNILGANVTVPHKQAVVPLLDALSDAAAAIGAVNTVVKDSVGNSGRLIGHNTDAAGFLRALLEADFEPRGKRVVVLGAGGAARAVVYALLTAGVAELDVYNRTPERAQALVDAFSPPWRSECARASQLGCAGTRRERAHQHNVCRDGARRT